MFAFWRRGFSGVSHAQVLKAMGVGRQSSYDTFGNRRSLFERAFAGYAAAREPVFAALLAQDADLRTLRRHFLSAIGFFTTHPETPACLATRTLLEGEEDVRALGAALMREMEAGFEHCLRQAGQRGQLRDGVRPVEAARAASLLWHGVGAEASGGASRDDLVAAVDSVLRGWTRAGDDTVFVEEG